MVNKLFDQLQQTMDQQKQDWEKIDGLFNVLKGFDLSAENQIMFSLLVLLANQIRPMGQGQMVDIEKEIESIVASFSNLLKDKK